MFLRQISTYPFPSICVSDFVSMLPFVICIISTPSLSVQHDLNLGALNPKVLFLQMCTPAALRTCVLQVLQWLGHRICLWGCWTLQLSPQEAMNGTPAVELCFSFCVLLFVNTGALITVQKLILTAKLVTPSVPLALPSQL